ncbi:MAG: hypothetical protein U0559_07705 [Anaerolineae bacterium]
MYGVRITLEGHNLTRLPDLLLKEVGDAYIYTTDHVTALVSERYYLRVNSELMLVVFMNFVSDSKCEVEILSGGGREGVIGLDWGAESSYTSTAAGHLRDICKAQAWKFIAH